MTTKAAENLYLTQHLSAWKNSTWKIFNPQTKPLEELPVIYGFNNGGSPQWWEGCIIAEDGTYLGGHICSNEGYMPADLGVLKGCRPDRHENFQKHYPNGYKMEFVGSSLIDEHEEFQKALVLANKISAENKKQKEENNEI